MNLFSSNPKLVILVVLDSARADHMSCYGYGKNTAPNLSQLIDAQGAIFQRAYSAASWTLPSTASILTGVLPSIHRRFHRLKMPQQTTFPQVASTLSSAGIYTEAIASNFFISDRYRFDEGFNQFTRIPNFMDISKQRRIARILKTHYDKGMHQGGPCVLRRFKKSVRAHRPIKSFYYLHLNDTHATYNVPRSVIEIANERKIGWRELLRLESPAKIKESLMRRYDGAILFVDQLLGQLVDFLREQELWQETVLMVVADHGEMFGEYKDYWGHGTHLSPTLLHVPLMLISPQLFSSGHQVEDVVRTIDIAPTVAELFGVNWQTQYDSNAQGTSLMETIARPSASPRLAVSEEWVVDKPTGESDRWMRSATDGHYQVIHDPKHDPELYDLTAGMARLSNLWNGTPPREAQSLLDALTSQSNTEQWSDFTSVDGEAEVLKRLQMLGYED